VRDHPADLDGDRMNPQWPCRRNLEGSAVPGANRQLVEPS
jgi:hypothetical protein